MSDSALTRLLQDVADAAARFDAAEDAIALGKYDEPYQLVFPDAKDWPAEEKVSADERIRQALSRLVMHLLAHDKRASSSAALALQTPRDLKGDNIRTLPAPIEKFNDRVLRQPIADMVRTPAGATLSQKLETIGIAKLIDLISPSGLKRCRLLDLTQAEFETLDDLVARFCLRLPPGIHPRRSATARLRQA